MKVIKEAWSFLKEWIVYFNRDNAFMLAAALSYYTVFSFGPLLVVVIVLAGMVFGRNAVHDEIATQLSGLLGPDAAEGLQTIIKNSYVSEQSGFALIIGLITLFIGATGLFTQLKNAINQIWEIRLKPQSVWNSVLSFITTRFISFGMVATIGFLLLVSLIASAFITTLSNKFIIDFPGNDELILTLSWIIGYLISAAMFGLIYKVLPDASVRWKDVIVGSLLTALLFALGRELIGFYIGNSNHGSTYGAAGSLISLLVWSYYTAIIIILGTEFTFVWAKRYGQDIYPNDYAVRVVKREWEIQDQEVAPTDKMTVDQLNEVCSKGPD